MAHEKEVTNYETGEVETVNDNFVQLYVDKLDLIIEMTGENKTAVQVLTWILKHMDKYNALVVSQGTLANVFEVTERSVRYSIAYLKRKKALIVFKSGSTNIYAVNAQIAWKADADNKKYARFNAAVYITESEQEKPVYKTNLVGHIEAKSPKKKRNKAIS